MAVWEARKLVSQCTWCLPDTTGRGLAGQLAANADWKLTRSYSRSKGLHLVSMTPVGLLQGRTMDWVAGGTGCPHELLDRISDSPIVWIFAVPKFAEIGVFDILQRQ
jgi:hypothetical protein